jgi:hypothetical protein
MIYEIGSILAVRNLWAVITAYEGSNYRVYFPFSDSYETVQESNIHPIIGKFDLDKAYFTGVKWMCQAKNPHLQLKWTQSQEDSHE